ncbi:hypothetical protein A3K86_05875 [Photobacterium jeanii]|uniref:Uncharacterized protein n=1 Tax=Photobacterium jeanii TaxID=858640 RepID=A0A178KMB7_9GAMM|nr:hypothetical protein A3K86_05875 [Photobacterium jeanii]PST91902.1 hypothetical protein C9I91_01595 [Photobacterium jeanii]
MITNFIDPLVDLSAVEGLADAKKSKFFCADNCEKKNLLSPSPVMARVYITYPQKLWITVLMDA